MVITREWIVLAHNYMKNARRRVLRVHPNLRQYLNSKFIRVISIVHKREPNFAAGHCTAIAYVCSRQSRDYDALCVCAPVEIQKEAGPIFGVISGQWTSGTVALKRTRYESEVKKNSRRLWYVRKSRANFLQVCYHGEE